MITKTFEIGRKGNQNFSLEKKEKVSDIHARITIDDEGRWMLEDAGSLNGTFILNENGDLVEIRKKQITEFTRVVLADTTAMGATFYPHHLLEQDANDYRAEFAHVIEEYSRMKDEKDALEESLKSRRLLYSFIPVVFSFVAGVILRTVFNNTYTIISAMSAVTAGINILVTWRNNNDQSLKQFTQRMQKLSTCPHCGRALSESDIINQMCPQCKSHA